MISTTTQQDDIMNEKNPEEDAANSGNVFIPIIKGGTSGNVIELKINNASLPLKEPVSFQDFTENLMPALLKLDKYINLTNFTKKKKSKRQSVIEIPLTQSSFKKLWKELTKPQKSLVHIINSRGEITKEDLFEEMNKRNLLNGDDIHYLYSLMAILSKLLNSKGYEPLFNKKDGVYTKKPEIVEFLKGLKK